MAFQSMAYSSIAQYKDMTGQLQHQQPPQDRLRVILDPVLEACPIQAGPLYTSYKDLALSVEWHDLRALVLPGTTWAAIVGHKRCEDPLRIVIPLPLQTTSLRPSALKSIFASLATLHFSILPPPDAPLVPSVTDIQSRIAARRQAARGPEADASTAIPANIADTSVSPSTGGPAGAGVPADEASCQDIDTGMIYLAIVTTDSTVVYYKLSKGIKKPTDIPDE